MKKTETKEFIWVDGEAVSVISVRDRGLAYGDGVFETIRVVSGRLSMSDLHWQRLEIGVKCLGINLNIGLAKEETSNFLDSTGIQDAILKVIVTRGSGGRGYNPTGCQFSRRILSTSALPSYPASLGINGINVRLCKLRLGKSCLAGIKHLNRLEQVIARSEWSDSDCHEGLLLDFDGLLVECTMSNIFLVTNDSILVTPCINKTGVAGVCRQYILEGVSSWGFPVKVCDVSLDMLVSAKEVFICNSVNGVWPVVACDHKRWSVGEITQYIRKKVSDALNV